MVCVIYKISVGNLGFYIGSAKNYNVRLGQHRRSIKKSNLKIHQAIRDNNNEFVMEKLHDFECETNEELRIEERRVYDELKPNLNNNRPYITAEEIREDKNHYNKQYKIDNPNKFKQYYIDNKDKIDKKNKQWMIDNADKVKEKNKQWRTENADKIKERSKEYYNDNKEKRKEKNKQWRTNNADKIKEHSKEYYNDNKDKIREKHKKHYNDKWKKRCSEKINCECGFVITKGCLLRHLTSQRHINGVKIKTE